WRSVLHQSVSGSGVPSLEPSRWLARGRIELALHADVALHRGRSVLSLVSRHQRRVAIAAVPSARHSRRNRNAEVLFAAAEGTSRAGQAQPTAKTRLHLHHLAGRAVGAHGLCHLQTDAALLAHGPL